jgi:hypothetical protein
MWIKEGIFFQRDKPHIPAQDHPCWTTLALSSTPTHNAPFSERSLARLHLFKFVWQKRA